MVKSKIIRWLLIFTNLALLVLAILFYRPIFIYLIIGFLFAYIIAPIINYAEGYHISRTVSILTVYIIFGFVLFFLISAIIPLIVDQFQEFQKVITKVYDNNNTLDLSSIGLGKLVSFFETLEQKIPGFKIEKTFGSFLNNKNTADFINNIPQFFMSIANLIAFLIIIPVISFFILKDGRKMQRSIFARIGNRYFEFSIHLLEEIEQVFGKFLRAILIETFLVALLSVIALLILGIPYALILGLIVGLANPIKYFGPFIGAIPTLLIIILGPTPDIFILYVIIAFVIVQQIDSLILFPVLVGKSMDMHPLLVLLTVIAGGYAFGVLGLLFAVPVVFLIKTIVQVSHKSLKEFEIT